VVALRGEVARDVVELLGHAGQQPVLQPRVETLEGGHPVEALPGVQPVLQPAGSDVGRVAVGCLLVDPAVHERGPDVDVRPLASDRERVRHVEAEV